MVARVGIVVAEGCKCAVAAADLGIIVDVLFG